MFRLLFLILFIKSLNVFSFEIDIFDHKLNIKKNNKYLNYNYQKIDSLPILLDKKKDSLKLVEKKSSKKKKKKKKKEIRSTTL